MTEQVKQIVQYTLDYMADRGPNGLYSIIGYHRAFKPEKILGA